MDVSLGNLALPSTKASSVQLVRSSPAVLFSESQLVFNPLSVPLQLVELLNVATFRH